MHYSILPILDSNSIFWILRTGAGHLEGFTPRLWRLEKIPTAPLPTKFDFRNTYYNRRPIIFKGLANSWEASKWDLDFFSKKYGTNMVSIQIKEALTKSLKGPVRTVCIHQSLKEYILN